MIADDEVLLRQGLSRLLSEVGVEVTATAGDTAGLMRAVSVDPPDVAIVDIKMPPTHTDEGLVAAQEMVPFGGFWAAEGQQTLEIEPMQSCGNQRGGPADPHE